MEINYEIAKDLLAIKAVQIKTDGFFTWTSGLKSPIYCDNRLTMSYPDIRKKITEAFAAQVNSLDVKPDVIVGCATAGISHATSLADYLGLPLAYVRSKPKAHGKGNQIEGEVKPGQRAIVIEDLISTGGSSLEVAKALVEEGVEVVQVFAIFTYGLERSANQFAEASLPLYTITSFDQLIDVLVEEDKVNAEEKAKLLTWRNNL